MKRAAFAFVALVIVAFLLAGCGSGDGTNTPPAPLDFSQMGGTWSGSWHNTTFNTTGGSSLAITVDSVAKTMHLVVTLTGNVFGGVAPPPIALDATYTDTTLTITPVASALGTISATIGSDGKIVAAVTNIPGGIVSSVNVTGIATATAMNANYLIHLAAGGTASGNVVLTKQ